MMLRLTIKYHPYGKEGPIWHIWERRVNNKRWVWFNEDERFCGETL